jgi:hypothetical protein
MAFPSPTEPRPSAVLQSGPLLPPPTVADGSSGAGEGKALPGLPPKAPLQPRGARSAGHDPALVRLELSPPPASKVVCVLRELDWLINEPLPADVLEKMRGVIIWPVALTVALPVDRYRSMRRTIAVMPDSKEGVTARHMVRVVQHFYRQVALTDADIKDVRAHLADDHFRYKRDLLQAVENNPTSPVFWMSLLGATPAFEGLLIDPQTNRASLELGS